MEFKQLVQVVLLVPAVWPVVVIARRLSLDHGLCYAARKLQDALDQRFGQHFNLLCGACLQHQRRGAAGIPIAIDVLAED